MNAVIRVVCLCIVAAGSTGAAGASLYSSVELAWINTNTPGSVILDSTSNTGDFVAFTQSDGIGGHVSAEATYGIIRGRLNISGTTANFDIFRSSSVASSTDEIVISGGTGTGFYERTFTITGDITGSPFSFNVVRSRLMIDNGGAIFNLTGPGEFTYRAAFNFNQSTSMTTTLDLALSAPRGNGGDVDFNFANSVVLTGLRVTDSIGRPIAGNFTFTSTSGTVYPINPVPLPAGGFLFLTGLAAIAPRLRRVAGEDATVDVQFSRRINRGQSRRNIPER